MHPLDRSNFLKFSLFSWINQCIKISSKNPWQQEYHYELPKKEDVKINAEKFSENFERTKKVFTAIISTWKCDIGFIVFLQLLSVVAQLSMSMLLKQVIDDIQKDAPSGKISSDEVYTYVAWFSIMILVNIFTAIIEGVISSEISRISLRIRSS